MTPPPAQTQRSNCKLCCRRLDDNIPLLQLTEVISQLDKPSILGGNYTNQSRYSYWAAEPIDTFEFCSGGQNPFEQLEKSLAKYRLGIDGSENVPQDIFYGGWVGYFSYELGRYIEKIPQTAVDDLQMPLIRLCFYDKVICYDHVQRCFWLFAVQVDGDSAEDKLKKLCRWLDSAKNAKAPKISDANLDMEDAGAESNMTRAYYRKSLSQIKKHIIDGDVYQVNFSQRFSCLFNASPISLYHWQNAHNPSPYAAYIDSGNFQIVSASPELFIQIAGSNITTTPIKGTRPRAAGDNPEIARWNDQQQNQLMTSEKEQAELNMIIDLERNDLGRICKYGTIKVVQPRTVTAYPTLFHALATVAGELRDEITFSDILKAMFPGGSITGAPKVSAMQIIDRIEPNTRGVYTGCVGFIGINASVCLNIAIRTIIISDGKAFCYAGGGIVADSDIDAEYDETLLKAKALLAGINAVQKTG